MIVVTHGWEDVYRVQTARIAELEADNARLIAERDEANEVSLALLQRADRQMDSANAEMIRADQAEARVEALERELENANTARDKEWSLVHGWSEAHTPEDMQQIIQEAAIFTAAGHAQLEAKAYDRGRADERAAVIALICDKVELITSGRMRVTADPGSEEPSNFRPDRRTLVAMAAWVLDQWLPDIRALGEK